MNSGFELVEQIGRTLYGGYWHKQLAADLDISDRAFRVWRSGRSTVPVGIWQDLIELVQTRIAELGELAATLSRSPEQRERVE